MPSDAVRTALRAYARFVAAERVQRGRILDPNADYKGANVEYVRARAEFGAAMDELKAVAAREGVQAAAEAGSPQARMLEANR